MAIWSSGREDRASVHAAVRPASGRWQAPVDMSASEPDSYPGTLSLAVGARGDAVATWVVPDRDESIDDDQNPDFVIYSATRPAGGGWQEPVRLNEPDEYPTYPTAAVDRRQPRSSSGRAAAEPCSGWSAIATDGATIRRAACKTGRMGATLRDVTRAFGLGEATLEMLRGAARAERMDRPLADQILRLIAEWESRAWTDSARAKAELRAHTKQLVPPLPAAPDLSTTRRDPNESIYDAGLRGQRRRS